MVEDWVAEADAATAEAVDLAGVVMEVVVERVEGLAGVVMEVVVARVVEARVEVTAVVVAAAEETAAVAPCSLLSSATSFAVQTLI